MSFPSVAWGSYFWHTLHISTLSYDGSEQQRQAHLAILDAWQTTLPCVLCRGHFRQLMLDIPPNMESKMSFALWGLEAHNSVNKRLDRREWSKDEFLQHYMRLLLDASTGKDGPELAKTNIAVAQAVDRTEQKWTAERAKLTRDLLDNETALLQSRSDQLRGEKQLTEQRHIYETKYRKQDQTYLWILLIVMSVMLLLMLLIFILGKRYGSITELENQQHHDDKESESLSVETQEESETAVEQSNESEQQRVEMSAVNF